MAANTSITGINYQLARLERDTQQDIARTQAVANITIAGLQKQSERELGTIKAIGDSFIAGINNYYTNKREEERYMQKARMEQLNFDLEKSKNESDIAFKQSQIDQNSVLIEQQKMANSRARKEAERNEKNQYALDTVMPTVRRLEEASLGPISDPVKVVEAFHEYFELTKAGGVLDQKKAYVDTATLQTVATLYETMDNKLQADGHGSLKDLLAARNDPSITAGAERLHKSALNNSPGAQKLEMLSTNLTSLRDSLAGEEYGLHTRASQESLVDLANEIDEALKSNTLNDSLRAVYTDAKSALTDVTNSRGAGANAKSGRFSYAEKDKIMKGFEGIVKLQTGFSAASYRSTLESLENLERRKNPNYDNDSLAKAQLSVRDLPMTQAKSQDFVDAAKVHALSAKYGSSDIIEKFRNSSPENRVKWNVYMRGRTIGSDALSKVRTVDISNLTFNDRMMLEQIKADSPEVFANNPEAKTKLQLIERQMKNTALLVPLAGGRYEVMTGSQLDEVRRNFKEKPHLAGAMFGGSLASEPYLWSAVAFGNSAEQKALRGSINRAKRAKASLKDGIIDKIGRAHV